MNCLSKAILENENVFEMVCKNRHSMHESNVLYDTCDGKIATSLDDSSVCFKLHLYIDEFEVCNPTGAKRGKYKLTAVYIAMGNMPVRYTIKSNIWYFCVCW